MKQYLLIMLIAYCICGTCRFSNNTCSNNHSRKSCSNLFGKIDLWKNCNNLLNSQFCPKSSLEIIQNNNKFGISEIDDTSFNKTDILEGYIGELFGKHKGRYPIFFEGEIHFRSKPNSVSTEIIQLYNLIIDCDCQYYINNSDSEITLYNRKYCKKSSFKNNSLQLSGVITISGKGYTIIQSSSNIVFENTKINLINGADCSTIYWIGGSEIHIKKNVTICGIFIAYGNITNYISNTICILFTNKKLN